MTDFLKIDTQMGLTFSGMALLADDSEKRDRLIRSARKAYDTVVRLEHGTPLAGAEATQLNRNLQRLRSEFESLGETFSEGQ